MNRYLPHLNKPKGIYYYFESVLPETLFSLDWRDKDL